MSQQPIVKLSDLRAHCESCSLYDLCLPMGLEEGDLDQLDKVIKRRRPVEKNKELFRIGESMKSVYAVRSGSFKTYTTCTDGTEQVIGFHLPGELLGLDAISSEEHICTAKALETASVCEIPFDRLEQLTMEIPGLQHQLLSLMSQEIRQDQSLMLLLAQMPAETRLATFLIGMAQRFKARGYSEHEFNLSMSRSDIANMLGMAVETISRLFSHFQDDGLLKVDRKHITILDMDGLKKHSASCATSSKSKSSSKAS